jgi:hypothetical protein
MEACSFALGVDVEIHKIGAVAASTIALAVATFLLAAVAFIQLLRSRGDRRIADQALEVANQQAQISERQAVAGERALQAQIRAILIEVPIDVDRQDRFRFSDEKRGASRAVGELLVDGEVPTSTGEAVKVAVPFLNAGPGIAQAESAWIELGGRGYSAVDLTRPNIPPGEETRALFYFRTEESGHEEVKALIDERRDILVAIRYHDIVGRQVTTTRVSLRYVGKPELQWEVVYVEIGEPDTGEVPPPGGVGPPRV